MDQWEYYVGTPPDYLGELVEAWRTSQEMQATLDWAYLRPGLDAGLQLQQAWRTSQDMQATLDRAYIDFYTDAGHALLHETPAFLNSAIRLIAMTGQIVAASQLLIGNIPGALAVEGLTFAITTPLGVLSGALSVADAVIDDNPDQAVDGIVNAAKSYFTSQFLTSAAADAIDNEIRNAVELLEDRLGN